MIRRMWHASFPRFDQRPVRPRARLAAGIGVLATAMAASAGAQPGRAAGPAPPLAPGGWPTALLNPVGTRHSPLVQITPANVRHLEEAWRFEGAVAGGWEGGPLVIDSVMYLHSPFPNRVLALDLRNPGTVLWQYHPPVGRAPPATAARGTNARGLAWHPDGIIFVPILPGDLAALDARTGREIWRVRNADRRIGASISGVPLVAGETVLIGMAGSEYGTRGYLTAYRAVNGELLWRGYSAGPDEAILVPRTADPRIRGVGISSWLADSWRQGGGTVDGWLTWDPTLQLVYHGTGAPAPWNGTVRTGDAKWTSSILARELATGQVRWAFQTTSSDAWGFGAEGENILADLTINGTATPALLHVARNGFAYTLNRRTGQLLIVERAGPANWVSFVDPASGIPAKEPRYMPAPTGSTRGICPATVGMKGSAPAAFSPESGLLFAPLMNLCMDVQTSIPRYAPGEPYLGATWRILPGPGPHPGRLIAWDPTLGAIRWEVGEPYPLLGGALATASGLVFYATTDGWLKAVDQANGRERWRHRLPGGSIGAPITFLDPQGRQCIALLIGVGGWLSLPNAAAVRPPGWSDSAAGMLIVFRLPTEQVP